MIHLRALHLANEFMPLSLGAEDVVIHKMMPLSAYLTLRRGRERNPCSASLVPVSPSFCAWWCKRAGHRLALTRLCSRLLPCFRAFEVRRDHGVLWKNLTPLSFLRSGTAYPVTVQKAPSLVQLGHKLSGIGSPILHLKVKQGWNFGQNVVKRRLDFGCSWVRRQFWISGGDRVLTRMTTTSLRWLWNSSMPEPFHTMPEQLLSSGPGPQRYCPPPALLSWIPGKLRFEDGRRANLCHST